VHGAGSELAEVFGASLRPHLPAPITLVADNVSRCKETAARVAKGLGAGARLDGTTDSLDPVKWKVCRALTSDEMAAGVREMLHRVEDPADPYHETWVRRQELLEELQALAGQGAAPSIATIANAVSAHGSYVGGLHVSAEGFIENFLQEAGAGLSVAWGRLDGANRSQLYSKWLQLDVLYNRINHGGRPLSTRNGPVILDILRQLAEGTPGTRVVVGHDTNVDAVGELMDLSWTCGPFPELLVPPMAGLLFESSGSGHVAVRAVCAAFEGDSAGKVIFGSVMQRGKDLFEDPALVSELQADLRGKLNLSCSAPAVLMV